MKTQISHYRVLSLLGVGGMGEVYLAEDMRLNRSVAIKLLPAELTRDEERVRRFSLEARAASALNHPNIVTIHELGEDNAGRFIVMEFVQGTTLRDIRKPCPLDAIIDVGAQIARALNATHAAGITHCDIKPENIMLRDDGYVKILDFGLARLIPNDSDSDPELAAIASNVTPGALLGTVAYMSPEQASGEPATHATDIFALGIVLYELSTGHHPFRADTVGGTIDSITSDVLLPASKLNRAIPAALDRLLSRMLEKDASLRPTALDIDSALTELAESRAGGAGHPTREGRVIHREKGGTISISGDSTLMQALPGVETSVPQTASGESTTADTDRLTEPPYLDASKTVEAAD